MRRVLLLAAMLTTVPMGFAQEKSDKDKLQGEWKMVSWSLGGKDVMPREFLDQAKVIFKGDTMVFDFGKNGKEEWSFKLDATKTPKAIDIFGHLREGEREKVVARYLHGQGHGVDASLVHCAPRNEV
jgi:uncharacterized protein (TIGR03067 family)